MNNMKGEWFSKLFMLHRASIEEGLNQLLRHQTISVPEIFKAKRSILMVLFAPDIGSTDPPIKITDAAKEFCIKNTFDINQCKVFVRNISYKVRERELWNFFEYFGKVLRVSIPRERRSKKSKGFGFVVFSNPISAKNAISAHRCEMRLDERLMTCQKVKNKSERSNRYSNQQHRVKNSDDRINMDITHSIAEEKYNCQFDMLHDDLIVEVFLCLCTIDRIKVEMVCKRWQRLALDSWGRIHQISLKDIRNQQKFFVLDDRILISIVRKGCHNLKSLDVSGLSVLSQRSFDVIAKTCSQLTELNLTKTSVDDKSLKYLGKKLPKLKKVSMERCLKVGEKGLWWFLKGLAHLTSFTCSQSSRLTGKCFFMLPPTIKTIDLNECCKLTDEGVRSIVKCPSVVSINLSFCTSLTDEALLHISKNCKCLSDLSLAGLLHNVRAFHHLAGLTTLIQLDISRNAGADDQLLENLSQSCIFLRELNLESCHPNVTSVGIKMLASFSNLIHLNISYILAVSDDCLADVIMVGKLKFLLLKCTNVTNEGVMQCFHWLRDLQKLDVSDCYLVNDALASLVGPAAHAPKILVVGGTEVTGEGRKMLEEELGCYVSALSTSQVLLRHDEISEPFFLYHSEDDRSDDSEDDGSNEKMPITNHDTPSMSSEDFDDVDSEGDGLCEIESPVNIHHATAPTHVVYSSQISLENESWEDELVTGRVWEIPVESLKERYYEVSEDEFLAFDDEMEELHG